MAFPTAEDLAGRLDPLVASHGLDLEHVKSTPAGKKSQVVVRVDGDVRPSSDVLEALSGEISTYFDTLEADGELNFGAGYTLEVSTLGVDFPLRAARHFRRNRGRRIAAGRLGALSPDEQQVILVKTVNKDVIISEHRIEDLAGSVVEIEFAKAPEAELAATELEYQDAADQAAREN